MVELIEQGLAKKLLKVPKWIDTRVHDKVRPQSTAVYQCVVEHASVKGRVFIASVNIGGDTVRCVFFRYGAFIQGKFKQGTRLIIEGKVQLSEFDNAMEMAQPTVKKPDSSGLGQYHPKYSEKTNVKELMFNALAVTRGEQRIGCSDDTLIKYGLMTESDLMKKIHLTGFDPHEKLIIYHTIACIEANRLANSLYGDMISTRSNPILGIDIASSVFKFETSPHGFKLTSDQRNALLEINKAFIGEASSGINILGDVSTGKSITAALVIKAVIDAGYAAIVMQPNTILSNQFSNTCKMAGIEDIQMITGSTKDVPSGNCIIGTQALLHRKYKGNREVALVVIDEIQKFGTQQFTSLFNQHKMARCVSMTATMMPRSIMRARLGGMNTVILKKTPKPRTVYTKITSSGEEVRNFIKRRSENPGEIVYLVHPSIDSEIMASVERTAKKLEEWKADGTLPSHVDIFCLHGKHSNEEKNEIIQKFKSLPKSRSGIIVSTSILEIGFHHDSGNTMVILEGSAHGLSALHQLRGRVGRHKDDGYCLIFTSNLKSIPKLNAFASTNDGFEIAEMDMKNRGYGELIGNTQSGKDLMCLNFEEDLHQSYMDDAISQYATKERRLVSNG